MPTEDEEQQARCKSHVKQTTTMEAGGSARPQACQRQMHGKEAREVTAGHKWKLTHPESVMTKNA